MKTNIKGLLAVIVCLNLIPAYAQMPGRPGGGGGPRSSTQINAAMAKLFGENSAFSATLRNEIQPPKGEPMTIPGKISFDHGKSRFEMNLSDSKGMPPQAVAQMKSMGMEKVVNITRPDQKSIYILYPGLEAYAEMPMQDTNAASSEAEFKVETTELGKETVDGHPTVKNKATVTDAEGKQHDFTVWNATDLKKFPVKIETADQGTSVTMSFQDVKLAKQDASLFEPPSSYKKYGSMMEMMQTEMMKRMNNGAGGAMPPSQP
ncbi:MAG: hypothetical protein ACTHLW_07010 [Verrucomicrobiota bacterium]